MRWGLGGWIVCAALAAALVVPARAAAKECGGEVACACGDAVRGEARLESDLTGCAAGLRVKDGSVLDCAGHAILGAGKNEGIVVEARRSLVRDCFVSGFRTGIRVRGGSENALVGNELVANERYGIELALGTSANLLAFNLVLDSGDEGIHVGSEAHANVLYGNAIADSGRENLYLLDVRNVTVAYNHLWGAGSAAMYVKHSSNNLFFANEVEDRPIQLRGASDANRFVGNGVRGAGFLFQAYEDEERGWLAPRGNVVAGGSVLGPRVCFRFEGSSYNRVEGVLVDDCRPMDESPAGGFEAVGNSVEVRRE